MMYRRNGLSGLGAFPKRAPGTMLIAPRASLPKIMQDSHPGEVWFMGANGKKYRLMGDINVFFLTTLFFRADGIRVTTEEINSYEMGGFVKTAQEIANITTVPGQIPERYLKKMSAAEIDKFVMDLQFKKPDGTPRSRCGGMDPGEHASCIGRSLALIAIEKANLKFVNGLISHEQLVVEYKAAERIISQTAFADRTALQQLKDAGKVVVGGVVGFFSTGPTGIFTGASKAAVKNIADARATHQGLLQDILKPLYNETQNVVTTQEEARQNTEAGIELNQAVLIGTALATGALLLFGKDLKKLITKD